MIYIIAYLSIESRLASSFTHNMQRSTFTFIICSRQQLSKCPSHQTTAIVTTVSLLHTSHRSVLLLSFPPQKVGQHHYPIKVFDGSGGNFAWIKAQSSLHHSIWCRYFQNITKCWAYEHFFGRIFRMGCKRWFLLKMPSLMNVWESGSDLIPAFQALGLRLTGLVRGSDETVPGVCQTKCLRLSTENITS